MTLIKQWSDLSDEEKERLRKKMLRIEPSLAPKPDIKLVQAFDKKDPLGIQDGVREFIWDTNVTRTFGPVLEEWKPQTRKHSGYLTTVIEKEKRVKRTENVKKLFFDQQPSPLHQLLKDLQNQFPSSPTTRFNWPGFQQQPMTRYEAFQRLGPRARYALRYGSYVQANGYRFTPADLHNPPKPPQPPPSTGHQNLRWTASTDSYVDNIFSSDEPDIDPKEEMAKVTPHLILDSDTFQIVTPYNKPFINALKRSYPKGERSYDFGKKIWTVDRSETNVEIAKRLIREHFDITPQMFSKDGDIQATYDTAVDVTSKYGILGVEPTASQDEIKQAFRRIAKKLHGDVSDADQEFFILAKKAYDTLKDPRKRKRYDLARKIMTSRLERDTGLKLTSRDLNT